MARVFIPYRCETPAAIEVKGHRVLIVAANADDLIEHQNLLGGEEIRELEYLNSDQEALQFLAQMIKGGVVLAPKGVGISAMISNLERELPWVH